MVKSLGVDSPNNRTQDEQTTLGAVYYTQSNLRNVHETIS